MNELPTAQASLSLDRVMDGFDELDDMAHVINDIASALATNQPGFSLVLGIISKKLKFISELRENAI